MKVGIVGMPNAGKSSLFNALTRAGAEAANYPFTTIEPNVAVVPVEALVGYRSDRDVRLDRRKRVPGCLCPSLGQGVEEGRLAGVRKPDDSDLHRTPAIRK